MFGGKKVVVNITSSSKRTLDIIQTIQLILDNTVKPDTIFLNLSESDFPNKWNDISGDLLKIVMSNPMLKINWGDKIDIDDCLMVDVGKNTKHIGKTFIFDSIKPHNDSQYDVIVSLTSFPERFKKYDLLIRCLDSLVTQETTYKYHIVITLFKNDIPFLPKELMNYFYENDIEVLPCEEDLKGHKKYFYVMKKYSYLPIITVDDDMVYSPHMIQMLYDGYNNDKTMSYCGWVRRISYDKYGKLKPDIYWESPNDEFPNVKNVGFSGSGLLIPPKAFYPNDYYEIIISGNNIYHDEIILKKMFVDSGVDTCWVKNDIDGYKVWKKCSFITQRIEENSESKCALHKFNNTISVSGDRNGDVVVKQYLSNIGVDISIVIPVRNVTNFIDKFSLLMESIENQMFSRYEVVLVNDNSDDDTRNILNSYSKKDSRIKVFDNTGIQGIGNARNVGIDKSIGEFIWIIDGDDSLYDRLVLSRLYEIINLNNQVDIIEIKSRMNSGIVFDRKYDRKLFETQVTFKQGEYLTWNLSRNPVIASWGRVYNRRFLVQNKSIRFSNTKFCNDLFFRLQGDAFAKNVFISNGFTAYEYNMNTTTSISSISKKANNFDEYWKIFEDLHNLTITDSNNRNIVLKDIYGRMLNVLSTILHKIGREKYFECLNEFSKIIVRYDMKKYVKDRCFSQNYLSVVEELNNIGY